MIMYNIRGTLKKNQVEFQGPEVAMVCHVKTVMSLFSPQMSR